MHFFVMLCRLARITVSAAESSNYYHFYDNRLLPPYVLDAETARRTGSWFDPITLINQVNIQSVITTPSHLQHFAIQQTYQKISGYAYTGSGLSITRVEITWDNGATWQVCELYQPQLMDVSRDPSGITKQGKAQRRRQWLWVWWSTYVSTADLLLSSNNAIAVRAWDNSSNTQPRDITWNLTGMMNNSWHTVKWTNRYSINHGQQQDMATKPIIWLHPTRIDPKDQGITYTNTAVCVPCFNDIV